VRVVAAQITSGVIDTVEVKSSDGGSYETVVGDVTTSTGVNHTFATPGPEVWVRVTSTAGAVFSGKDSGSGKIVTAVFTEVIS